MLSPRRANSSTAAVPRVKKTCAQAAKVIGCTPAASLSHAAKAKKPGQLL